MLNYILHVSLLLGLGFILYQVLLKKETFYSLNRIILFSYLVLAFALPTLHIPEEWSLRSKTKITEVTVNTTPTKNLKRTQNDPIAQQIKENTDPKTSFQTSNPALQNNTHPSINTKSQNIDNNQSAVQSSNEVITPTSRLKSIDWLSAVKWIYFIGLGIFLINFLVQFSILIYYRVKHPTLKDGNMTIVEMPGDKAPFSFLNMIYINPTKYDYDTYEQILAHEKIHITKWHSADIFLSELALIIQWFNPFAWYYRKAVEHNLEYLTDQEMLASGANAEVYQMNLLKVSVPELPLALSTNYNQSFLKKRIQMMNSKKSSARSTWKYLFILPILGMTIAMLNPTYTLAQTEETAPESTQQNNIPEKPKKAKKDNKSFKETQQSSELKPILNAELAKDQKQNIDNAVDLQIDSQPPTVIDPKKAIDDNLFPHDISVLGLSPEDGLSVSGDEHKMTIISNSGKTYSVENNSGRTVVTNSDEDLEYEGIWEAEIRGDKVCFYIKKGGIGKNYFWSSTECMNTSDFSPSISKNSEGAFTLKRDAGTIVLKGDFEDEKGTGRYNFTPDQSFASYVKAQGYKVKEKKLIHFFLSDIDRDYFSFLKKNGYDKLSEDDLLAMAIHGVNEEYIQDINGEFRKVNYKKPSADELVALKIHDVDMEYIKEFGKEVYEDLDVDQIISAAIHDVDPSYISEFKELGYKDLSFDNLISAAIHDVDIEYIKELRSAGYSDMSFENLITASIHDIDPDYIKEFRDAGFDGLSFDQMVTASIHDVDPEYINAFKTAGFKNIDFDDLVTASIHNVDLDFIEEFEDAGFANLDFDDLISASIHNADIDYLKEAQRHGFELSIDQLIAASIHNVDLEYLAAFKKAGFKDLNFDDMVTASIHNVDPEFIEEFYALGYNDLDFDDLVSAAIHDVDIDYIKSLKELGFTDLKFDDFMTASIHNIGPDFIREIKDAGLEDISFDDVITFGIHNIDVDDIIGLQEMGFNLDADDLISAGIHNVTPRFIKKMQDKGYKNLTFKEYMKLKLHGF